MSDPAVDNPKDIIQVGGDILFGVLSISACQQRAIGQFKQFRTDLVCGKRQVDDTGCDGALRHPRIFGALFVLDKHQSSRKLDLLDSLRTVGAGAGKDHGYGVLFGVFGKGTQQVIDGMPNTARGERFIEMQPPPRNGHLPVGRNDMNPVRFGKHPLFDKDHFHPGIAGQQLGKHCFMLRIEMNNDDKRHSAVGGHVEEKFFKRLQPAC